MVIEELTVKGYGKLKDFRIEPGPGLNVISGDNETGKSSVGNCLRDLFLGPGRWDDDVQGPRAPEARPWDGERFQARARYRTRDGRHFTVQRDLETGASRARDDDAQAEIPLDDPGGPAPGVALPPLVAGGSEDDAAADPPGPSAREAEWQAAESQRAALQGRELELRGRVEAARTRLAQTAQDLEWSVYVWRRGQALALASRLAQVQALDQRLTQLRPRLQAVSRFGGVEEAHREQVARNHQRIETLDAEMADLRTNLEALQETRKAAGARLSAYEKFFLVTPEDLEGLKSLRLGAVPSAASLEEMKRNLEGFQTKDRDISARLSEIRDRFVDFPSDEDFESRVSPLEREVARTEMLASRVADMHANERKLAEHAATGQRYLLWGLVAVLMTVLLSGAALDVHRGLGWAAALTGAVAAGSFFLKLRESRASQEFVVANRRISEEVERMHASVDAARDGLRAIFETCKVTTIKDLRASYREFRALQRDLATVRSYVWNLEHELEASEQGRPDVVETPRVLIDCGIISEWEPLTQNAVDSFLEGWKKFQELQREEEGLKRRIHELMRELDDKREENERLKVGQSQLFREMGVSGVEEMDWAMAGRAEYEKLMARARDLEQQMRAALSGMSRDEAHGQMAEAAEAVRQYELAHPVAASETVAVDRADELLARVKQLHEQHEAAQGEMNALCYQLEAVVGELADFAGRRSSEQPDSSEAVAVGAMASRSAAAAGAASAAAVASPARPLTTRVEQAYREITQQDVEVRLVEEAGAPGLQVKRPGPAGGWMSPIALGRSASDLLHGLLLAERWRGGHFPIILENPFSRLDAQRQRRALEWLLKLADDLQVFFLTSQDDVRDLLRGMLVERGIPLTEAVEGELSILATGASA